MPVLARHEEGAVFRLSTRGHEWVSDNSPQYGGTDRGPMPSELLFAAAASCFGQAVLHVAKKMHKRIGELTLEVTGTKDAERLRIGSIAIRLAGVAEPGVLERVATLAKKYCYVLNSLDVPVTFEVTESPPTA
ncbi:MAG: OsmC family protein [Desulfovibrio sp.]|jgi:putative redox protein|nr:OsmC family protein [Desulfovibrio sp.]